MKPFKDLPVGTSFRFKPGVSTFSAVCVKTSARGYKWVADGGIRHSSKVGSINVTTDPIDMRPAYATGWPSDIGM